MSKEEELISATKAGNIKKVENLLNDVVNVNAKDKDGNTALHFAAWNGHTEITELLIGKGADVNAKNNTLGDTPLHLATSSGYDDIILMLLDAGAEIEAKTKINYTATHKNYTAFLLAAWDGHITTTKLLFSKGANIYVKDGYGNTALHYVACKDGVKYIAVAKFLLDIGIDVNAKNELGETALYDAYSLSRTEMIKLLKEHGAIDE